MRKFRMILLFTIINLLLAIVFISFLPDKVIFSFTSDFQASEYIGKWYNLIIPIIMVIVVGIIFIVDVFTPTAVHRYRYLIAWVAVAFTTYIYWIMLFIQLHNFNIAETILFPLSLIILLPIALFLYAEGYFEYYKEYGTKSIFGFSWGRSNEDVWMLTHRVAGRLNYVVATMLILLAVCNELIWKTNWIYLIALLVWFVIYYLLTVIMSKVYARRYN